MTTAGGKAPLAVLEYRTGVGFGPQMAHSRRNTRPPAWPLPGVSALACGCRAESATFFRTGSL